MQIFPQANPKHDYARKQSHRKVRLDLWRKHDARSKKPSYHGCSANSRCRSFMLRLPRTQIILHMLTVKKKMWCKGKKAAKPKAH